MKHAEFVGAYRAGKLQFEVDPVIAARMVASRMMLPWMLLPMFSAAVALALTGWLATGALLLAGAICLRWLVRRSAGGYMARRVLDDKEFFEAALAGRALRVLGKP